MFSYYRYVEHCLLDFLYQQSLLPRTLFYAQGILSSQLPCGCCVTGWISASAIEMILYLVCLLQPCHLLCPKHAWCANTCICLVSCLLFYSQPFLMYAFSSWRCASLAVASCISCIGVHTGRSTDFCIALIFTVGPHISLSLFSLWLCCGSQSAMNSSGPALYGMHTMYWCMHRMMHYMCCDNIATYLPIIATNGSWSVMKGTWYAK